MSRAADNREPLTKRPSRPLSRSRPLTRSSLSSPAHTHARRARVRLQMWCVCLSGEWLYCGFWLLEYVYLYFLSLLNISSSCFSQTVSALFSNPPHGHCSPLEAGLIYLKLKCRSAFLAFRSILRCAIVDSEWMFPFMPWKGLNIWFYFTIVCPLVMSYLFPLGISTQFSYGKGRPLATFMQPFISASLSEPESQRAPYCCTNMVGVWQTRPIYFILKQPRLLHFRSSNMTPLIHTQPVASHRCRASSRSVYHSFHLGIVGPYLNQIHSSQRSVGHYLLLKLLAFDQKMVHLRCLCVCVCVRVCMCVSVCIGSKRAAGAVGSGWY